VEKAVLTITFDPATGRIDVTGPIANEPFALWLVDKAKDSIKEFNKQAAAQRSGIVPVNGGVALDRKLRMQQ
jgi:hypothetical protein